MYCIQWISWTANITIYYYYDKKNNNTRFIFACLLFYHIIYVNVSINLNTIIIYLVKFTNFFYNFETADHSCIKTK